VHLHGGETTEGALDEFVRHAVTKLAHFHFASADENARRILQMGEDASRVWSPGALAMDNIAALKPVPRGDLERFLGLQLRSPSFLVTYHPVTLDPNSGAEAVQHMLDALEATEGSIIITGTNADPGATRIRACLEQFAAKHPGRVAVVESLGTQRYLSLMREVDAVVGNSSSGLLEAPAVGVATVNIGDRQKGRLAAPSVLHSGTGTQDIRDALARALSDEHQAVCARRDTPYGRPGVAQRMTDLLEALPLSRLQKPFVPLASTSP
jgi:UDP-hydrolysing UDP-N-acetyl-D-glucosamine 2-epimerase